MARTLNPVTHAVRRESFLDAAQVLIQTKGYEALSIQDVLEHVGASKGAFYHYFDSKAALLEGVVARMVDGALGSVAGTLNDPAIPAVEKLRAFATGLATFKAARREFLLALIQVWLSDENAIVRDKFRRGAAVRLRPVIAAIVSQGVAEGTFDVADPDSAARVFVAVLLGLNETATELFLAVQAGTIGVDEVERQFDAFNAGLERVLGASRGTLALGDRALIREWYGPGPARAEASVA